MSINVSDNQNEAVNAAASYLSDTVEDYLVNKQKPFVAIGLSGGSLIKHLSQAIINNHRERFAQFSSKLKFFYIDERFVPFTNDDSTHKGFLEANLFSSLNIPDANVYAINPNVDSVEACADDYEARVKSIMNENNGFDIMVVGFGPDGHICSLFPGHPLFVEKQTRIVASISDSPKPPPQRVTLTMPVVNNSSHVLFCGFGDGKAAVLKQILVDKDQSIPAACVEPLNGTVKWFLDRDAAKLL